MDYSKLLLNIFKYLYTMRNLLTIFLLLLSTTGGGLLKAQSIQQNSMLSYGKLAHAEGIERILILNELAGYRLYDTIRRSIQLSQLAIAEATKINDPSTLLRSLNSCTAAMLAVKKGDSALLFNQQAGYLLRKYGNLSAAANYHFLQGRILLSDKKYNEALAAFDKGVSLAEREKTNVLLGTIYLFKARIYKLLHDKEKMLLSMERSTHYFGETNDPIVVGPLLVTLAVQYLDFQMNEKASTLFIKSIEYTEAASDSLHLGYAYSNVSAIYTAHGLYSIADQYYKKSLAIFRAIRHDMGVAYVLNLKGMDLMHAKEYQQAYDLLSEAAILKKHSKDWQGACFVYSNLCELLLLMQNKAEAERAIHSAGEMYDLAGDQLSLAAYLESKGKFHAYCKEFEQAMECYSGSLTLARGLQIQGIIDENLLAISEMYQAKGDAAAALSYYKRYVSGKDSVQKAESVLTIAEVVSKYESDKKDQQIRKLQQSVLKTERGTYYLFGNVVAVLLLLFVAIIFFFRLKGNYRDRLHFMLTLREQVSNQRDKAMDFLAPLLPDKASKPMLTEELRLKLWHQMRELMEKEKLFLNPNLSLGDLARRLNSNTSYVSRVINELSDQNFSNFLNQYRIEEACRLLSNIQGRNMTIEGIAQTVGFNSKSAFNTAFRKFKSVTPSEFMMLQIELVQSIG